MDEKRSIIKKQIEEADIPEFLKVKELEIINNENLSTPEVVIELTRLISDFFDNQVKEAGVTDIPQDKEVEEALHEFESEALNAEKDLKEDMKIVDESLKAIRETSEEIQKTALQSGLNTNK